MTREEIKKELSDVLLDLGGLSFSDVNNLLEGDSAITFEGEDLIEIAEHFYNLSKKGLWDAEKVIEWLDHYADSYTYYNVDKDETEFIGQMFDDLRKSMED